MRISGRVTWLLWGVGAVLLAFAPSAHAQQKITPSHVLQVADDVTAELQLLLDANFSDTTPPEPVAYTAKHPRHVIQKARQILLKVQLLKEINGLAKGELDPVAVKEIVPADVKGWLEKVLGAVRELRGPFKVTATPAAAPLGENKTPSDVFQRLVQVEAMVGRLDLPATVPNDVYRVSLALVDDFRIVAEKLGVTQTIDWQSRKLSGKTPNDVYNESLMLLAELRDLTAYNEKLKVPGGISIPKQKVGRVTPGEVIEIQNTVMAELSSIKNKVGLRQPTRAFGPQAGKTPSDSLVAIQAAREYISLIDDTLSSF